MIHFFNILTDTEIKKTVYLSILVNCSTLQIKNKHYIIKPIHILFQKN